LCLPVRGKHTERGLPIPVSETAGGLVASPTYPLCTADVGQQWGKDDGGTRGSVRGDDASSMQVGVASDFNVRGCLSADIPDGVAFSLLRHHGCIVAM
jgi:hypothetical protein